MNDESSMHISKEQLFKGKEQRRRKQAALPIEQKIAILIKLQTINAQLARQKGRPVREPWKITHSTWLSGSE